MPEARRRTLLGMPIARFLREFWQKKPLLVRGALADFKDPFTADELAGLSCEEGVESRIVRERGGAKPWEIMWGPQPEERFAQMPTRGWTLLVQELNRHVPEAALLLERFNFIPNVRVDDVMVSYAAPGGSVGPHLDSYDVFLVQGMGERRWKYSAQKTSDCRFRKGLDLRILERFVYDHDDVLEPGDMLYLPPGFAHHGVAETPCLTYSVGFRAPAFGEMWKSLAAHASANAAGRGQELLVDPALVAGAHPGAIPPRLLASVRAAVRSMDTSDEAIDRWFAAFATRLSPGHEFTRPRQRVSPERILARLERGDSLVRSEEGRWAYLSRKGAKGALFLYVGGEELEVGASSGPLAIALCGARRFSGTTLSKLAKCASSRALLVRLFELGALGFGSRATRPGLPG